MKDVVLPLRIGYVGVLQNMVVGENTLGVYDMIAPSDAQEPYIIIQGISPISNNTKTDFGYDVTVDLLVYSRTDGDFGGREETDLITNKILELLIPTPGKSAVQAAGFNVISAKLVAIEPEFDIENTGRKYRNRITIEHIAWQE